MSSKPRTDSDRNRKRARHDPGDAELVAPAHFGDRLLGAIDAAGSPACVGLDPVVEKLPREILKDGKLPGQADKIEAFCLGVIEAVAEAGGIAAVKPQSACFERFGAAGVRALKSVVRAARQKGFAVILDAKRGDIGISAEHYAAAAFGSPGENPAHAPDAMTVSAYLGFDTVEPFLRAGRGAFVLVRTSNPGSDTVQGVKLADGRTVAEMMADHVSALGAGRRGSSGMSDVGAVVGATKSADASALRARMPDTFFLVPGFGAQGGTLEDIRPMLRAGAASAGALGVLVNASRSVTYAEASQGKSWQDAVAAAAKAFAEQLKRLAG